MRIIFIGLFFIFAFSIQGITGDDTDILSVYPVPSIPEKEGEESVNINKQFHGKGVIDRIAIKEIVIDDTLFKLALDAKYYSKQGKITKKKKFITGNLVGYFKNSQGIIVSLWKI